MSKVQSPEPDIQSSETEGSGSGSKYLAALPLSVRKGYAFPECFIHFLEAAPPSEA